MALIVIAIGVSRNRSFKKKHDLFQKFAEENSLGLAFHNPFNFRFYGNDPKNTVRIEPYRGLVSGSNSVKGTIFTLSLINPELKTLKIFKLHEEYPWLSNLLPIDNAIQIKNNLGEKVQIQTNDMLFSSFLLSQDIIIDLGVLFNRIDAGVIYIYGDELGCIIPYFVYEEGMYNTWGKVLDLLLNLKAELQV
ncbi:MAG: hypothetical protein AAF694_18915 [Bacteroidota bacterium]